MAADYNQVVKDDRKLAAEIAATKAPEVRVEKSPMQRHEPTHARAMAGQPGVSISSRTAPEQQKAAAEPRRLPTEQRAHEEYAKLSDAELVKRYEQMSALAAQGYVRPAQTFEQLPEVKAARAELVAAERAAATWQREADRFTKEHPIRAKMGREPVVEDQQGRKVKLSTGLAQADARVEKARLAIDRIERSGELNKKAERSAEEHNRFVDRANWERGLLQPYKTKADEHQREAVQRWEQRLRKERELERDNDRGPSLGGRRR